MTEWFRWSFIDFRLCGIFCASVWPIPEKTVKSTYLHMYVRFILENVNSWKYKRRFCSERCWGEASFGRWDTVCLSWFTINENHRLSPYSSVTSLIDNAVQKSADQAMLHIYTCIEMFAYNYIMWPHRLGLPDTSITLRGHRQKNRHWMFCYGDREFSK